MINVREPLDLFRFISIENENFLVSIANNRDEFGLFSHVHGLYRPAMSNVNVTENEAVIFQLITFIHYHLLFSTSCLIRCHLSEAFASARAAIDAALIGAMIIKDRSLQVAYAKRERPFDKLNRHLRNFVRDKKPLPHHHVGELLKLHDKCSAFASHADIGSFVHRIDFSRPSDQSDPMMTVEYFQFAKNQIERKIHCLALLFTFVMILDVFSDFLVFENEVVPLDWQNELHGLGAKIEKLNDELKVELGQSNPGEPK